MSNLFYRNRQLLVLTLFLLLVWGVASFQALPRLEDPEITERFALVTTRFAGASAERVESLVTEKIEQKLFEIEEIDTLESTSRLGLSTITVELKETVGDVEKVWSRVRDKVADAVPQLPPGTSEPEFENSEVRASALIVALTWDLPTPTNQAILRRLAEELEDRLRFIPGTEKVEFFGDPEEEILVEIEPADLAMLGLTAQDLSTQIRASDAKVAAGRLRGGNDLLFEVEGELDSLARVSRIPIRSSNTGQTRLGDIARVSKGTTEPLTDLALVNGRPAIALSVLVESGQRLELWAETAHKSLEEFRGQLPDGVGMQTILDQSRYVQSRLDTVMRELLFGSVLVMAVTLFMMGWRSALVIGAALPLSALMVFGGMKLLGVPLHQISVTGLIIALGLLIDNAIVIVDEVRICAEDGMSPGEAVAKSVRHMTIPLSASTLTTVLAFLPIATAPGGVGEFTGTIGVSAILGIGSSLLLALTVIPALAGRLHAARPLAHGARGWWQVGFADASLSEAFRRSLDWTFARPFLGVGLALVIPVVGFLSATTLQLQFFPPAGRDQFYIDFELQAQSSIAQTQSDVLKARALILRHPEVSEVSWFAGESAPPFFYNVVAQRQNSANYAQGLVQLKPYVQPRELMRALQAELDRSFPRAQVLVRQLEQGPPFDAPIELRLYGPDPERLRELGNQVRAVLARVPDVIHTRANLTEALPKLSVGIDEEQARLSGLDNSAIARQLDSSLEGSVGGSILEETEELPVRVRLSNSDRSALDRIISLDLVAGATGARTHIPLTALGSVKLIPDLATISRRNGERINTVQGFITAGVLPSTVLADFERRLAESGFKLPPGYSSDLGGEADARNTAVANIVSTVGVLGILMVATLVLTFGSFRLAGLIGLVALLSVGLGLGALGLFGYPFGFTAILGIIGLIGIAVNESIVVLDALKSDRLARQGDPEAVREVVTRVTRHMVATTVTDIVSFVPLLFDSTGFWPPLAIVIAGGLGGSTLLTLYFLPCVYMLTVRGRKEEVQTVPA